MKKLSFLVLVLVFSLLWIACPDGDSESTGNFWAQNYITKEFYRISAQKLAENSRCEVWVEDGSGVTEAQAKRIADEYEKKIYVKMMNTFGYTINDKDLGKVNTMEIAHYIATGKTTDAKLTILLLDIQDGFKDIKKDPFVGGYFASRDLYKNEDLKNAGYDNIKSNEREMIYVDTYPSDPASQTSYETLAHEMQHLMNFVSTIVFRNDGKKTSPMETWCDEGLAGAAQWVYSGKISEERLDHYNKDYSGLIKKGNNFYVWDNHGKESNLANLDDYATVYLFFQYLRLQSADPEEIYFDIISSKYPDYRAVTAAKNINSNHKDNWPLLLRDWHAANYIKSTSGLYGYKNDPKLQTVNAPMLGNVTSVNLFPGEGVYSKISSTETLPSSSGNISYAGLSSSGNPVTSGSASGARLTYNIDTNLKGSSATGSTTGVAANTGISITDSRGSLQIDLDKFSFPFQVDAGYFLRRNGGMPDNQINYVFNNSRSINKDNKIIKFDTSTVERVYINE